MTIGVDAGCLSIDDKRLKTGVYYLTKGVLQSLSQKIENKKFLLYSFDNIDSKLLKSFGDNFENKIVVPKKFWMSLAMSLQLLSNPPDVFLGFGQALPLLSRCKKIVFVYDLAFELFPGSYPDRARLSKQTRRAVTMADIIIAISESTRNDLEKIYRINSKKIKVIYPGCDRIFKPKSNKAIQNVKMKYKIDSPYLLFVGSFKPLKNIQRIITAFSSIKNISHKLVIVGSNYWITQKLSKQLDNQGKVVNLGYISRSDMPALYSGADVFVSPSLYEGFGIPILESMSCGTPVITSSCSSMPEVVGKTGITVNPRSDREISESITKVINDSEFRQSLSKKTLARSKKFSNDFFSNDLLKIINSL